MRKLWSGVLAGAAGTLALNAVVGLATGIGTAITYATLARRD
jgi:hypothetical protein